MTARKETRMITAAEDEEAFAIVRKMRDNEMALQLTHKRLQGELQAKMNDRVAEHDKEQGELAEELAHALKMPEYGRETHALDTTHMDAHGVAFVVEKPRAQ